MRREVTNFGTSVNHVEDVKYQLIISNRQLKSYLECNKVDDIRLLNLDDADGTLVTSCQDCSQQSMPLIDGQISEILRYNLRGQMIEGLFWSVAQLLYNQHFSNPISIKDHLDRA